MSRNLPGTNENGFQIGDVSAIDITGTALTISAWVKPSNHDSDDNVVGKRGDDGNQIQYQLAMTSSGFLLSQIGDSGNADVATGGTVVPLNVWSHVALVKNGTGSGAVKLYLNAVEDASITSNRSIQNRSENLHLGKNTGGGWAAMTGLLAEVVIWDASLSLSEIQDLYEGAGPLSIKTANVKGYWPLYGTASPETDLSGNGNNASIIGTVPAGTEHINIVSSSATSSQSLLEPQETITNTETSSQSAGQSVASTLSNSSTATHRLTEVLGYLDTVTNSALSSQSFGTSELPVIDIEIEGVNPGGYHIPDSTELALENLDARSFLEVVSLSGSDQDLTFITTYTRDDLELEDRVVTIPAGTTKYIGNFPAFIYNSGLTTVYFEQETPGALKFRAFRLI